MLYALHKPVGVRLDGARHARPPDGPRARARAAGCACTRSGGWIADSSGLILLTNDGELANRLTHPRFEVPKTYRAQARRRTADRERRCDALRRGVELEDGPTAPARVRRVGRARDRADASTRGATARCGACARRSATACSSWSASRFGPLRLGEPRPGPTGACARAEVERLRCARALTESPPMRLFALRGATSVERNDAEEILDATTELMQEIMRAQRARARDAWSAASSPPPTTSTRSSRRWPRARWASRACRCCAPARSPCPARCRA